MTGGKVAAVRSLTDRLDPLPDKIQPGYGPGGTGCFVPRWMEGISNVQKEGFLG